MKKDKKIRILQTVLQEQNEGFKQYAAHLKSRIKELEETNKSLRDECSTLRLREMKG
jgi:hypothetical protein